MTYALTTEPARRAAETIAKMAADLQHRHKGRRVRMLEGKYAGRVAEIDGVTLDVTRGEWLFCCYVLRTNGSRLNTDGASRQYHPTVSFHPLEPTA